MDAATTLEAPQRRRKNDRHGGARVAGSGKVMRMRRYTFDGPPSALRAWFEQRPQPMTKAAFAAAVGCSASFVSQLCADNAPWPRRDIARRIGEVTKGEVTPNDLAGYRRRK